MEAVVHFLTYVVNGKHVLTLIHNGIIMNVFFSAASKLIFNTGTAATLITLSGNL